MPDKVDHSVESFSAVPLYLLFF